MKGTRSNSNCFRKKGPLRVIAIITLWSFLFSAGGGEFLVEKAWAARTPLELTSASSKRAGSPAINKLNVKAFSLPEYLGKVNDSWASPQEQPTIPVFPESIGESIFHILQCCLVNGCLVTLTVMGMIETIGSATTI